MTARNNYISNLVRETHAQHFHNRSLSVFCVSNKAYKTNVRRVRTHELPIKGSGIPALRSHCHKIPARAQFRIADHFLTVKLKDLVQRVQLWLTGGSRDTVPNDKTVQKLLETLQTTLQEVIDYSSASNLGNNVVQNHLSTLRNAEDVQGAAAREVILRPMGM
jgi:hypothetical protein